MWWKTFVSTFVTIFLAELGDKTQLATLALAVGKQKWVVFAGAAVALTATSLVAVLAGELVARWVKPVHLTRAAGVLFLVLGAWTLWSSFRGESAG